MLKIANFKGLNKWKNFWIFKKDVSYYVQGQEPEPKVREYFYFIDHHGMLFLDDSKMKNFTSCFKDKKFLNFFFQRIKLNDTNRYADFPFLSICGKERNFIRCDDLPIVYTHIIDNKLSYGYTGNLLLTDFKPDKIFMSIKTGRIYHPAIVKVGSIGLIRSKLAIELSKYFLFNNSENSPPTHFKWDNKIHELDRKWIIETIKKNDL